MRVDYLETCGKREREYARCYEVSALSACKAILRVHTFALCGSEEIVDRETYIKTLHLECVHPFLGEVVVDVEVLEYQVVAGSKPAV